MFSVVQSSSTVVPADPALVQWLAVFAGPFSLCMRMRSDTHHKPRIAVPGGDDVYLFT